MGRSRRNENGISEALDNGGQWSTPDKDGLGVLHPGTSFGHGSDHGPTLSSPLVFGHLVQANKTVGRLLKPLHCAPSTHIHLHKKLASLRECPASTSNSSVINTVGIYPFTSITPSIYPLFNDKPS